VSPAGRNDKEILKLVRDKVTKERGYELLIRQYQRDVYWLIRRLVIDHDDTDDLVQDTFIKVWRHLDSFRGESGLFTWIYRIATNEALGFLKKKRGQSLVPVPGDPLAPEGSMQNDAFFRADEVQRRFQQALSKLPAKQRLVFQMKYYDELRYEEISKILGTSVGALKASYYHAVKKIEKYLTDQ
jgi:RNA polymerase sigma-70 factor (ECF subfamily)